MEKIGGTRKLRATQERIERNAGTPHAISGEPVDISEQEDSLKVIFANPKKSEHLTLFIKDNPPSKRGAHPLDIDYIVAALGTDKVLTEKEGDFVEKSRSAFNKRSAEFAQVREVFTEEEVRDIARMNPNIARVIGQIGVEKSTRFLVKRIEELAFTDGKKFSKLVLQMREERTIRNSDRTKRVETRTGDSLKKYGISEDAYAAAALSSMDMTAGISAETRLEFRRLAREQIYGFKGAMNFLSGGAIERWRAFKMAGNLDGQRQILNECDKRFAETGKILNSTLNPDINLAIQQAMMENKDPEDRPEYDVRNIADFKRIREEHNLEGVKKRLKPFLEAEALKLGKVQDDFTDAEREAAYDRFADEEVKLQDTYKPRGIFSVLLSMLFVSKQNIKDEARHLWK